jgi:hypothetical protein
LSETTRLFPRFSSVFRPEDGADGPCPAWSVEETQSLIGYELSLYTEFINTVARSSFGGGLLRFLLPTTTPSLPAWNSPLGWMTAWPNVSKFFVVFAFDWQGNQYGFDKRRMQHGEPLVGLLEPGHGKLLKIPVTFADFIERELVDNREAVLAPSFYAQWLAQGKAPTFQECVGYRVPPFLNGKDEAENLELSDMEVYLSITGQAFAAIKGRDRKRDRCD